MRVVTIWRDKTDYARMMENWLRDFERRFGFEAETVSPDDQAGESLCRAYDVVEYPTIMVLDNTGKLMQSWRGKQLPLMDDVAYYFA